MHTMPIYLSKAAGEEDPRDILIREKYIRQSGTQSLPIGDEEANFDADLYLIKVGHGETSLVYSECRR